MESEHKSSNLVLPVIIGIVITIILVAFLGKHYIDQEKRKEAEAYENQASVIDRMESEVEERRKKNESDLRLYQSFSRVWDNYEKGRNY